MNKQASLHTSFFGSRLYFFIALLSAAPIYIAVNMYVKSIHIPEDEAVSSAVTAFFIVGVFAGRYLALVWFASLKKIPAEAVIGNIILLIASTIWLFFHADFPLKNRPAINLFLSWLPVAIISVGAGILIKMIRITGQRQLQAAQAEAAQRTSELHLLQSQLSPHFLFNTLNNMYGLSITQHEKVPALILKLSELLRYSVYEANDVFVPLNDEIAYINNYIDFEKLRLGDRLDLTTDIQSTDASITIPPMLLMVFIENAFKHSKNTADQKIYIDIELKTWHSTILCSIKNSQNKTIDAAPILSKHSGFGLESVRKRLDILYKDQYELTIQDEATSFHVLLQLKTPRV